MLASGVGEPLGVWVTTDNFVEGIDENNFEELESGVFSNPVGVQYAESSAAATNTSFGGSLEIASVFELVDTMSFRLAVGLTLGDLTLTTSTADTDAVDNVTYRSTCEDRF